MAILWAKIPGFTNERFTADVCDLLLQLADPWEQAQDMMLRGTVAEGTIVGFNKGGVLVDIGDLKGGCCETETCIWQ